jgi:hypothetical protein
VFFIRVILAGLLLAVPLKAQRLPELVRSAPVIFTGTIVSIMPQGESVAITVRVEDAIKGVGDRSELHFQEWKGRWTNGTPYHAGERLIFFLRAPSEAGLTSPLALYRVRGGRVDAPRRSARLGRMAERTIDYSQFVRRLRDSQ